MISDINMACLGMAQTLGWSVEQVQAQCTVRELLLYLGTLQGVSNQVASDGPDDGDLSAEDFIANRRADVGAA